MNSVALLIMKANLNFEEAKLSGLLRTARPSPSLPPRFSENVWQRIETSDAPARATGDLTWMDALVALVLRPRFAVASVAVLMLSGILLGAHQGWEASRDAARAHYVALVAPNPLR